MNVEILEENEDRVKFLLEEANTQFANALRRAMISEVPTMAVKEVDFLNNTSGLFDEIIAHRIGMIPWEFPDDYRKQEECDCEGEGCQNCQVEMVLKKEGPGEVTASDFKPTDKKVETSNPDILIVKLLEGQEIELEAKAVLGTGDDHAKFQAANAAYKYYPVVEINGEEVENNEEAGRVAPEKVKKADGAVEADEDIVYAMENTVDIEEGDEVEFREKEDTFIFRVTSVSGLSPREIMERAVDVIEKDVKEFEEASKEAL